MFMYPLTYQDAVRAFVKFRSKHTDKSVFDDSALAQLYADEANGLCTITIHPPTSNELQDSVLEISYTDPELEFVRRLQL